MAQHAQPSLYDLWRKEIDQYLAISPAERTAQDRHNRERWLAGAEQRRRDDLVKQAAWEEWQKQGMELFMTIHPVPPPRAAQLATDE